MTSLSSKYSIDVLAIAAHRDDIEQTCGGTLLKISQRGQRTGILDLTKGEMGTRGTAEDRAREAEAADRVLGVTWRRALDIPDSRVENTWENRLKVAHVIRETRPRVLILPYWKGRHPDHYTASILGYEACFLAGLAKLDPQAALSTQQSPFSQNAGTQLPLDSRQTGGATALPPHRPFKIIYATLYYDIRPTFVVDITEQFEARLVMAEVIESPSILFRGMAGSLIPIVTAHGGHLLARNNPKGASGHEYSSPHRQVQRTI